MLNINPFIFCFHVLFTTYSFFHIILFAHCQITIKNRHAVRWLNKAVTQKKYKKAVDSYVFLSLTCSSELAVAYMDRLVYELAPGLGSVNAQLVVLRTQGALVLPRWVPFFFMCNENEKINK